MTDETPALARERIEAAIAAQERLRDALGDQVVETTLAALRAHLPDVQRRQRKLATLLFADVVGSTQLLRGLDPEATMAVMDPALTRLARPIAAHGGRVTRFMGDGFLAVFGLPTAHENDPEMAVRAGLEIVAEAARVAIDLQQEHDLEGFDVRVGVSTGLVVTGGVTEAADTIMGDAVNLAARLEAAAPGGAVLCSHDTYQHIRGRFEVEAFGSIRAKGFEEAVRTYRVLRRTAGDTEVGSRGLAGLEIPIVGRQRELDRLRDEFDHVTTSGRLRAVTVVGEAGIGKSRVVAEFRGRLPPDGHVALEARASHETGQLPYALVKDLLERRFDARRATTAARARERLVEGIAHLLDAPSAATTAEAITHLIGYHDPDGDAPADAAEQIRNRSITGLAELVTALAEHRPLVVILEDVHWADADSLHLLGDVLRGVTREGVLLVATCRPALDARDDGWIAQLSHRRLDLEPLSRPQSEELADAALRRIPDCPDELRARIVQNAAGNPYYLEEIIQMLVDDGVIVPGDPSWTVDLERLSDVRIPPTIAGVVQARLDALPEDQRLVLQRASIVGRTFWDSVVRDLTAGSDDLDVGPSLTALAQRGIVHPQATSSFAGATEYAFHNEVQRSIAYESVLRQDRRTFHSLVADWLIAHRGDRPGELDGLIADHLERAGRDDEALERFARAADAALGAYAVEAADTFFDRALSLAPSDAAERRFALLLGRETTLAMRGLHQQQRATIDELASLAGDDPVASTQVAVRRVWAHYYAGEYVQAVAAARSAAEWASRTDDGGLQARARAALAVCLFAAGDFDAARPEAEHALTHAIDADDDEAAERAHSALGLLLVLESELSAAREHIEASIAAARRLGDLKKEITNTLNLGVTETRLGNYDAARTAFEEAHRTAEEVGDRVLEVSAIVNLAWVAACEGAWARTLELLDANDEAVRALQHPDAVAENLMWRGHAHVGTGSPDRARAAFEEALAIRQELGQTALAMGARAGIARAALAAGDLRTALTHTRTITDHLDAGGSLSGAWEPLRIHLTCVQVLRAADDATASRVLERAHRLLLAEADHITDPHDREAFLRRVPWHREIIRLADTRSA